MQAIAKFHKVSKEQFIIEFLSTMGGFLLSFQEADLVLNIVYN